jgi:fructokinase
MSRQRPVSGEQSSARNAQPTVVCFGEVLWDCLPKGLFLGGAPINAAYHLAKHGLHVLPVTAVGRDFLGDEAVRRIGNWGLETKFIGRDSAHPTGVVTATLDPAGAATYQIKRNVAWDHIPVSSRLRRLHSDPVAIVHGTLALRDAPNRHALQSLVEAWPEALRVVDLNFRPPFDTAKVTGFALENAQLVKLNDGELAKLTGVSGRSGSALERGSKQLSERCGISRICVTAGDRGAGLWWDGEWFWEDARPVKVRDTVGAGDSFLGALLGSLLFKEASPPEALQRACRVGEFVASYDGATPDYRLDERGRPVAAGD